MRPRRRRWLPTLLLLTCILPALAARAKAEGLDLSGSFRLRFEHLEGQFRPGRPDVDGLWSTRTILAARWTPGSWELATELIDSRALASRSGGVLGTSEVNTFEPVQVFMKRSRSFEHARLRAGSLGAGRFTLDLGSRRLVGRNTFRNTTNAFTGLLATLDDTAGRRLTLLAALPQNRRPTDRDALERDVVQLDDETWHQRFVVAYLASIGMPWAATLDAYVMRLDEDDDEGFASADRRLTTTGLRWRREPKGTALGGEVEIAWQSGARRASSRATDETDLDVNAWLVHADLARRLATGSPWRLGATFVLATGDERPDDARTGRFDGLFGPRRSEFGPTSLYGPLGYSNVISAGVELGWSRGGRANHLLRYRPLWLHRARDAFALTGVVDPTGTAGNFAGHQIDARTRWSFRDGRVLMEVGGAWLAAGRFLDEAPNATGAGDTFYLHADTELRF